MRIIFRKFIELYLRWLTKLVIYRHRPDIIAVSGITNKTTTKKAIMERLAKQGLNVRGNPRSYNTEIGLPLAVLYLELSGYDFAAWLKTIWRALASALGGRAFPKVLVLEFGVSQPGDMKKLLKIVRPRVAVFTNIHPSSFNPNVNIDELTLEMAALIKAIPPNGFIIYNYDDDNLRLLAKDYARVKTSYGFDAKADVVATHLRQEPDGLYWETDGRSRFTAKFGEHHVYAELAADALNKHYG